MNNVAAKERPIMTNAITDYCLPNEIEIVAQVERILNVDAYYPSAQARAQFACEFDSFARWCEEQDLRPLPACGHVVAAWLLDLIYAGASEREVWCAAAGLRFMHDSARQWLNMR